MGSAEVAKERIGFTVWLDRINELLAPHKMRTSEFKVVSWQALHSSGMSPKKVVEAILSVPRDAAKANAS